MRGRVAKSATRVGLLMARAPWMSRHRGAGCFEGPVEQSEPYLIGWSLVHAPKGPLIGAGTIMSFPVAGGLWLRARGTTGGVMPVRGPKGVEGRVSTDGEPNPRGR